MQGLKYYISKSKKRLITVSYNSIEDVSTKREKQQKLGNRKEKKNNYVYFKQQTDEIAHQKTWMWP